VGESMRGRLVVAAPSLLDPNFDHTVVFLLDHSDEGALGIVVNRPSDVEVADALPRWEPLATRPRLMFVGGPVQPEAVVGLGRPRDQEVDALQPVSDGVAVVDLRADPLALIGDLDDFRLFVGYAGWGKGQLEAEIAEGGWFVVDAQPEDVFAATTDELWVTVLARQGGLFRTISENPSLN
jgi:putative transcriptional regulator